MGEVPLITTRFTSEGIGVFADLELKGQGEVITTSIIMANKALTIPDGQALTLKINPGSGDNSWTNPDGNIHVGAGSTMLISEGQKVISNLPISNNGTIQVDGRLQPTGTMTGSGDLEVLSGGQLGGLGIIATDTFTSAPGVTMRDNSSFEVLISPTLVAAQKLVAETAFTLGKNGVNLNLNVDGTDAELPLGTTFVIVDYPDSYNIQGQFLGAGGSPLEEGELITAGLNVFQISYADPDYDPQNTSVITLTTRNPAFVFERIPTLSQLGMAFMALLLLGFGFFGMRRLS